MTGDPPSSRPVGREAVDLDALRARVSAAVKAAGFGDLASLVAVQGGASSLTFAATVASAGADRSVIVKAAPPGLAPVRNRDVLRQAALLSALASVGGLRIPRVLAQDAGDPPWEPPLFVMSRERGQGLEPIFTRDGPLPGAGEVRGRAVEAARMLGVLHAVDAATVGLESEPTVAPAAELERWVKGFGTVDPELRTGADEATEALRASVPEALPSTLLHGDYRLGNILCEAEHVVAVIDWELWGRGDPRTDLAWFLLHRHPSDNPHADREAPGMPSERELLDVYAEAAGHPVGDLRWFRALVRFKQAAAGALIVKHGRRSGRDDQALRDSARRIEPQLQDAVACLQ